MTSWHIHIKGRVQGVGFRPFIFRIATENQLKGTVANTTDGVHIKLNSLNGEWKQFVKRIRREAPSLSIIENISIEKISNKKFPDFRIIHSSKDQPADLLITPDFAICKTCSAEIRSENDSRHRYAFNTCTYCGPRYSIIKALPYDRENTSMDDFKMCPNCETEYKNPVNRRFYSQTNSCPKCGIDLSLFISGKKVEGATQYDLINKTAQLIRTGGIVAVKGIGGYLLLADAYNQRAIDELRNRKKRPYKPFALMYPEKALLQKHVSAEVSDRDWHAPEAPIILYELNTKGKRTLAIESIAPGLDSIGVMPPYAPLFILLLDILQKPVVATSGNLTGSPIIYDDALAMEELSKISDAILLNNREIVLPQDDSVIRYSQKYHQKILLRRSRGLAPTIYKSPVPKNYRSNTVAFGASLKSAFAIWDGRHTYCSQFLGNTSHLLSQQNFEHTYNHLSNLLSVNPDKIGVDLHPDYFTAHFGEQIAESNGSQPVRIQHHKAHFAAVMAENDLLDQQDPVLGVVFDGTGYGDDGQIWGGEFFVYRDGKFERYWHLPYYSNLGSDRMAEINLLPALSLFHQFDDRGLLINELEALPRQIYQKQLVQPKIKTSSAGRLFDAVACLADLNHVNTFEGQAAMYLERAATKGQHSKITRLKSQDPEEHYYQMLTHIWQMYKEKPPANQIALQFHYHLADLIYLLSEKTGSNKVAFSGGVFQNGLLVDLIKDRFSKKHNLYWLKELSPNDENIAYGQLAIISRNLNG